VALCISGAVLVAYGEPSEDTNSLGTHINADGGSLSLSLSLTHTHTQTRTLFLHCSLSRLSLSVISLSLSPKAVSDAFQFAVLGDVIAVASALCASVYLVFFKRVLGHLHFPAVNMFLAYIGIGSLSLSLCVCVCVCHLMLSFFQSAALFIWPGILIVNYTNYEDFQLPRGGKEVAFFFLSAILSFLFNVTLNVGVYYTSPLTMKVATICSIPVSFFVSIAVGTPAVTTMKICGVILILLGYTAFSAVEIVRDVTIRRTLRFDSDFADVFPLCLQSRV
jgi:hypothetical protein